MGEKSKDERRLFKSYVNFFFVTFGNSKPMDQRKSRCLSFVANLSNAKFDTTGLPAGEHVWCGVLEDREFSSQTSPILLAQ
jgi:hypothetical protein